MRLNTLFFVAAGLNISVVWVVEAFACTIYAIHSPFTDCSVGTPRDSIRARYCHGCPLTWGT